MKYSEVLSGLYGNDLDKIIIILQKSIHASKIDRNEEGIIAIHTGFIFQTHKGNYHEILIAFNYNSNKIVIIRQPYIYNVIPLINGVRLISSNKFFNEFLYPQKIITEVTEENDDYGLLECSIKKDSNCIHLAKIDEIELDIEKDPNKRIRTIKVITDNNELEFPLQRRFTTAVFFDGQNFMRHEKNRNNGDRNDNSEYHTTWRNAPGTDDYYDEGGMSRDDEYNPENWQGHDG